MRKHMTWMFIAASMYGLSFLAAQTGTAPAGGILHPGSSTQGRVPGSVPTPQAGAKSAPAAKAASPGQIKFGPVQAGPRVTNPSANAAIIVVLQQQRQAAEAEAAQMKLGLRPTAPSGAQSKSALLAGKAPPSAMVKKSGPSTLGSEKTLDAPGSPSILTAPQVNTTVVTCTADPTMRILTVSGKSIPATFTSDEKYNFYTVTGCSFGDPGPNSKVYIYYQNTFRLDFQFTEWNDNGIKLSLKPNLTGLLDHDNLTLVVQRADGKEATKSGFKFYAARETKRLSAFPRSQFSLNRFTLNDTSHLVPTYESPSKSPAYAAEVSWDCSNCSANKGGSKNVYMQSYEDVWELKNLQPGFVVQNLGMAYRDLQCGDYQLHREGTFAIKMVGSELHAQWQGQTCVADGCGKAFQPDCFAISGSNYLVDITLTGPRGVDPWTGKPAP